jgi:hypothetical protein
LYYREIYNTLSRADDPLAYAEVDALGFSVQCGEVAPDDYMIRLSLISGGFRLALSVNAEGRTVGLCIHPTTLCDAVISSP